MLKALIKARFASMFSSMFRGNRGKKKRSPLIKILSGVLAVYVIAQFLVMFGFMFDAILPPLLSAGLSWLYFALAGIMAFALCFIGSVFTAQQQLFSSTDNFIHCLYHNCRMASHSSFFTKHYCISSL